MKERSLDKRDAGSMKILLRVMLHHAGVSIRMTERIGRALPPSDATSGDEVIADAERLRLQGKQIFESVTLDGRATLKYDLGKAGLPGRIDHAAELAAAMTIALFDILGSPITNEQVPFRENDDSSRSLSDQDIEQVRGVARALRVVEQ